MLRVCLVELNGKIVPACVTKLEKPSVIQTNSDRVVQERGVILALLKHRAPNSPEIDAWQKNMGHRSFGGCDKLPDADRCIMCGLCVRACRAMGTGAIATILRGTQKRVDTPYGDASAACIGCGSCASVCPTNSIIVEDKEGTRTIGIGHLIWCIVSDAAHC